ncbi:allophanate hydrolase subunit 1 [Nitratireductor sp. L1-7-SE]|uniref:Allophanate hydrolase subunit 1 n=1 Tax=Nitratireductor rhodophyticola TaxID=2854036 RepID=A0ABS7RBF7_9HYPH|nr:allophanate hydrolase subunit 1 [Nitratireductor rhodophyticola]MBY8917949.1 allophanate hydrolase subunit 1 [Nitratireductor rhodophyticola]MBY8922660.1 allophanate hydrolase subunit 1 [Nitratireductor rhodophyticola]
MKPRYTFGGDEHLFVEVEEEMSLDAFFKSLSMTRIIAGRAIEGVTEICPANASFQVKFDPDVISPEALLEEVRSIEAEAGNTDPVLQTRLIEVPVFYQDPWTHETLMRFRERHQDPQGTDLEYAARINGYSSVEAFIAAHSGSPWFVSMVGFVAGLPFMYQMVERERQIQVPKYLRPRTDTPKHTVGYGGCFSCIYSVRGAGGYQMFGITPMPIFDPDQKTNYLEDFMVFFRPGDIVKFKPIDRVEYDRTVEAVAKNAFKPKIREVEFDLRAFNADIKGYNARLEGMINGD